MFFTKKKKKKTTLKTPTWLKTTTANLSSQILLSLEYLYFPPLLLHFVSFSLYFLEAIDFRSITEDALKILPRVLVLQVTKAELHH